MMRFEPSRLLAGSGLRLLICATLAAIASCAHNEEEPLLDLYVFDCGQILVPSLGKLMSPGIDVGVSKLLFVPCYLVDHPKGRLVWDAGLSDSLAPRWTPKTGHRWTSENRNRLANPVSPGC